ncbi:MAG: two pore domain potassium channel family protein [Chloroflexi bacterium]|nr:MAG: two pore domain potassium channel family protein [Chloroflexota bacterium]
MEFARWLEVASGTLLVLLTIYDVFKSVVLPRPAINKFVFVRQLFLASWRLWKWISERLNPVRREGWLATFGPVLAIIMFAVWALLFIIGYGLMIDGLREEMRPVPGDFWESIYFSAGTLVPLSYGDFVPEGVLARLATVAESATGVGVAALAITLLFSLYESFQRREELVVTLDALAGAPPSGLQMLETAAELDLRPKLASTFDEWRDWMAAVLESHLAYPILFYFRSSHDNEAWLNSFGAVMDAATLVISTLDGEAEGSARLTLTIGKHLVEDMSWFFGFTQSQDVGVDPSEFDEAYDRLKKSGYRCRPRDAAWEDFSRIRARYASALNQSAKRFAIIPAQWIGDRSYIPHQSGRGRVRRVGR